MFQAWLVFFCFVCLRFYVGVLPSFGCMILDGPYRGPTGALVKSRLLFLVFNYFGTVFRPFQTRR